MDNEVALQIELSTMHKEQHGRKGIWQISQYVVLRGVISISEKKFDVADNKGLKAHMAAASEFNYDVSGQMGQGNDEIFQEV